MIQLHASRITRVAVLSIGKFYVAFYWGGNIKLSIGCNKPFFEIILRIRWRL